MEEAKLYRFLRLPIKGITNIFIRPKYVGLDNIPSEGRIILAGTHTNILDCFLLISSTKRSIHFLAKKELWKGFFKFIFANMGLIAVNRDGKDHEALELAKGYLNDDKVVGIFPEGTTQKGRGLLPFKIGAVKLARDTNSKIVPFVIKGKYGLFSNDLVIEFGKMFEVGNADLEIENDRLRKNIIDMLGVV